MSSLTIDVHTMTIQDVTVTDDTLLIDLADGRTVSAPLAWYPRLLHGQPSERNHWRLMGMGEGIHWPDLDEDVSAANILLGQASAESQRSFARWLEARAEQGKSSVLK